VEWFCGIEVNSARLIERYVAGGYGIGLAVAVPGFKPAQEVRVLELPEFSAGHRGRIVVRQALEYFEAIAYRTGNGNASADAPNERRSSPLSNVLSAAR
jgi:hypothetical protein